MPDRPTFELGLVMAGAVSARAYTAGVLDFLIEALDAIEDVRAGRDTGYLRSDEPDAKPILAPPHQLRLTAMSGTSAGAMVTGIFTTVLGTRVPPVGPDRQLDERSPAKNPLYDAWVQLIIVAFGVAQCVGNNLFQVTGVEQRPNRRAARNIVGREQLVLIDQRAYVGPKLPIYLCIGNLRGVRYSLSLSVDKGVVNEHQMSMHADWMGFCFDRDPAASLPGMRSLAPGRAFDHWQTLGAGALASGAFPVGLSARELRRNFTDYEERDWYEPAMPRDPKRRIARDSRYIGQAWMPSSWISQSGGKTELPPLDHAGDFPPDGEYRFVNVDGGVFNNEPLELCRAAVAGDRPRNPRDPQQADRAVLLIDPFPNLFELDHHYDPTTQSHILQVVRSLLGAFVSQARFKPDELALAKDPNVASRYAIMPIRYDANDQPAKYAIACGSLGGFGGFLSKAFRHHDFMLGRRNCQRFLSRHFVLPADPGKGEVNPLFTSWTDPETRGRFEVPPPGRQRKTDTIHLPIVPLLGKLASESYTRVPDWPTDPPDLQIANLRQSILDRADAVKDGLIAQYEAGGLLRTGISLLWFLKKQGWIERLAIGPILADLRTRGLLSPER
jgi:hypothetical protein